MRMQEMLQVETLDESRIPESPPTPSTTPTPTPTVEEDKDLVPTVWVDEAGNESEVGELEPVLRIRIGFNADPDTDPEHFLSMRIRIRILIRIQIQEFDDQKLKKNYSWKKNYIS